MDVTWSFWLLGALVVLVNLASTANAVRETVQAESATRGRVNAVLLTVRCAVLLSIAIISLFLWCEPWWLLGASLTTAAVQAFDLLGGILLRSRRVVIASSIGVLFTVGPLAMYCTGA